MNAYKITIILSGLWILGVGIYQYRTFQVTGRRIRSVREEAQRQMARWQKRG